MSLPFHCNSCTSPIPPTSPRISCNTCPSHFCASCYILSRSPAPHIASHPSLLYEYSGYLPRNPPQLPPRPPLQPVSTTASTQRRPVSTQLPSPSPKQDGGRGTPPQRYPPQPSVSASTTAPPSASPHVASPQTSQAPPLSEIPSSAFTQTNHEDLSVSTNAASPEAGPSQSSPYAYTLRSSSTPGPQTPVPAQPQQQQRQEQPPQQPPRPQSQQTQQPQQQTYSAAPTGWQPLYNNTAPTAFGMAFFNEIFNYLDINRTGLLLPEQYSDFLDVIGYSLDQNACTFIRLITTSHSAPLKPPPNHHRSNICREKSNVQTRFRLQPTGSCRLPAQARIYQFLYRPRHGTPSTFCPQHRLKILLLLSPQYSATVLIPNIRFYSHRQLYLRQPNAPPYPPRFH